MVTTAVAPAPDQQPAKIGAIGRVFGVLFSPGLTFEDIARKPNWIAPLLFLVVINVGLNIVLANRVDWRTVVQKQTEKVKFAAQAMENLPENQREAAYARQAIIKKYTRYGQGVIGVPLLAVLGALVYMGAFNILGGAGVSYSKSFALVCYAFVPTGIHDLLAIPVALMKDPSAINPDNVLASNLGALLASKAPLWQVALGTSVDLFGIWCLILLAIAFAAANPRKLTFGKAFAIAITVQLVFILIGVGMAALLS